MIPSLARENATYPDKGKRMAVYPPGVWDLTTKCVLLELEGEHPVRVALDIHRGRHGSDMARKGFHMNG